MRVGHEAVTIVLWDQNMISELEIPSLLLIKKCAHLFFYSQMNITLFNIYCKLCGDVGNH